MWKVKSGPPPLEATARQSTLSTTVRAKTGGKGIRTPDFQLAKLALYQLSYAPARISNFDCRRWIARKTSKMPDGAQAGRHPACGEYLSSVVWSTGNRHLRRSDSRI